MDYYYWPSHLQVSVPSCGETIISAGDGLTAAQDVFWPNLFSFFLNIRLFHASEQRPFVWTGKTVLEVCLMNFRYRYSICQLHMLVRQPRLDLEKIKFRMRLCTGELKKQFPDAKHNLPQPDASLKRLFGLEAQGRESHEYKSASYQIKPQWLCLNSNCCDSLRYLIIQEVKSKKADGL